MHRVVVIVIALVGWLAAPVRAEPAPRSAGFLDATVGIGRMNEPGRQVSMHGIGVRGGGWVHRSNVALEVAADVAWVHPLPPDILDRVRWTDTSGLRLRALAGLRVAGDRTRTVAFAARAAIGLERVSVATTVHFNDGTGDVTTTRRSGADLGPALELSAGCYRRGHGVYGLELAVSGAYHDGAPVSDFELDYLGAEIELRFVAGFER